MRVFWGPAYCAAGHAFDTTRKSAWIAESLAARPIAGVTLEEPEPLDVERLLAVHERTYVDAVRSGEPRALAESQGFRWDAGLWPMVLASNGGALAAAGAALVEGVSGSLSSGLHHARRDRGAGLCTFNGLAVAAAAFDCRVIIVDLDAHCGGGTHSLVAGMPRVRHLDVSVSDFDRYAPQAPHTLDLVTRVEDYLPTVERRLAEVARDPFDLCLYNAGMDPFAACPLGGLAGVTAEVLAARERLVFTWCRARRLPVAFVLAGGYVGEGLAREGLVELHRLTLEAAVA